MPASCICTVFKYHANDKYDNHGDDNNDNEEEEEEEEKGGGNVKKRRIATAWIDTNNHDMSDNWITLILYCTREVAIQIISNRLILNKPLTSNSLYDSPGIGVSIRLVQGLLEFSTEIDEKFLAMPRGLLGNFNDDATDDFIMPNGTVLPDSSTERELYAYGLTCKL